MENQVQVFENEEFGKVRVIDIDGQPWWVLKDVCDVLGLSNPSMIAARLDDDERAKFNLGRQGYTNIIGESGLYAVILRSDKPNAKVFRKWITSEVIPSIRCNGTYITDETLRQMRENQVFAAALVEKLITEKSKNRTLITLIEAAAPKVNYFEKILQSENAIPVTLIAKDYGMSARTFNLLLNRLGIQFKMSETWVICQPYADKGYTISKTYFISEDKVSVSTYWTQKGRYFLHEFLDECGIVPVCERRGVI